MRGEHEQVRSSPVALITGCGRNRQRVMVEPAGT
jgi:hypothetical protein